MLRALATALALMLTANTASADITRLFVPKSELESKVWLEHDAGSTVTVDHAAWDAFLGKYVSTNAAGINLVAYGKVSAADGAALDAYIGALQAVDPATLNQDEQLAYWINLYNAVTVDLVLGAYPVDTIRDVDGGLLSTGPWGKDVVTVSGRDLSLNDIEHGIVRPVYNDARIHYALNCAAMSCPNLGTEAYRGTTLDGVLTAAEIAYVNDPRGVSASNGLITLSSIYNWFREDFGANEAQIIARLQKHADGPAKAALAGKTSVDEYAYDWSLNGS